MNGIGVFFLILGGLLAVLVVFVFVRDRRRNAPSREQGRGTWGGGEKNPYGGATHDGAQRHYGNSDATGGGNP